MFLKIPKPSEKKEHRRQKQRLTEEYKDCSNCSSPDYLDFVFSSSCLFFFLCYSFDNFIDHLIEHICARKWLIWKSIKILKNKLNGLKLWLLCYLGSEHTKAAPWKQQIWIWYVSILFSNSKNWTLRTKYLSGQVMMSTLKLFLI